MIPLVHNAVLAQGLIKYSTDIKVSKTTSFIDGFAFVKTGVTWQLIDSTGHLYPEHSYVYVYTDHTEKSWSCRWCEDNIKEENCQRVFFNPSVYKTRFQKERNSCFFNKGKWGYRGNNGEIIHEAVFKKIDILNDSLHIVTTKDKQGLYTDQGKVIIDTLSRRLTPFDGYLLHHTGDLMGLKDYTGKTIISPSYEYIDFPEFRGDADKRFYVVKKEDSYTIIDSAENIITHLNCDFASAYSENLIVVFQDSTYKVINIKGKEVLPSMKEPPIIKNPNWYYYTKNNSLGAKYLDGTSIIDLSEGYQHTWHRPYLGDGLFSPVTALYSYNENHSVSKAIILIEDDHPTLVKFESTVIPLDRANCIVASKLKYRLYSFIKDDYISKKFAAIKGLGEGIFGVQRNSLWGIMDVDGKLITKIKYHGVAPFLSRYTTACAGPYLRILKIIGD